MEVLEYHDRIKSKWFLSIPEILKKKLRRHHGQTGHVANVVFSIWAGAIFEVYGPIWTILGVIGPLTSEKGLA